MRAKPTNFFKKNQRFNISADILVHVRDVVVRLRVELELDLGGCKRQTAARNPVLLPPLRKRQHNPEKPAQKLALRVTRHKLSIHLRSRAHASLRLLSSIANCAASYVIAAELLITLLQNRVLASRMSKSGVISHSTLNARRSSPPTSEHKSVVSRPGYLRRGRVRVQREIRRECVVCGSPIFCEKKQFFTGGGQPGEHVQERSSCAYMSIRLCTKYTVVPRARASRSIALPYSTKDVTSAM